jgi:hypothetical protein
LDAADPQVLHDGAVAGADEQAAVGVPERRPVQREAAGQRVVDRVVLVEARHPHEVVLVGGGRDELGDLGRAGRGAVPHPVLGAGGALADEAGRDVEAGLAGRGEVVGQPADLGGGRRRRDLRPRGDELRQCGVPVGRGLVALGRQVVDHRLDLVDRHQQPFGGADSCARRTCA